MSDRRLILEIIIKQMKIITLSGMDQKYVIKPVPPKAAEIICKDIFSGPLPQVVPRNLSHFVQNTAFQ